MSLFTQSETETIRRFLDLPADSELSEPTVLRNQVARITLSVVQQRLPQVGFVHDGEVDLGREHFAGRRNQVTLLPQFLFMINWADTAPGISWPESYHATCLPGIDRYIVTAAQDSPDMWGVTEMAIGHFPADMPLREGARRVIEAWWCYLRDRGDQERWAYVWDEGTVSSGEANLWADKIWPEFVGEKDEDA